MPAFEYINVHTHQYLKEPKILQIVNLFPNQLNEIAKKENLFYSIGIHPWYINENSFKKDLQIIEKNSKNEKILALGEIGLDLKTKISLGIQKEIFLKQHTVAEKVKKPVILHCVKAFNELFKLKKEIKPSIPWIIHGYNSNSQIANELIKNEIYISLGYNVLVDNSNAQKVLSKIPDDLLFIETDEHEIRIEEIYRKICEVKGIEIYELRNIIERNFTNVFIV